MKKLAVFAVALSVLTACTRIDEYESGVHKGLISGRVSKIQETGLHHSILRNWTVYDLREIQYPARAEADVITVLTSDQLPVKIEASYRYRVEREAVRNLVLNVGGPPRFTSSPTTRSAMPRATPSPRWRHATYCRKSGRGSRPASKS